MRTCDSVCRNRCTRQGICECLVIADSMAVLAREKGEARREKGLFWTFQTRRQPNNGVPDWSICA